MRKEDVLLAYNMLVQMRDLVEKLDEFMKKKDFDKTIQIKKKILELQGSLSKIL